MKLPPINSNSTTSWVENTDVLLDVQDAGSIDGKRCSDSAPLRSVRLEHREAARWLDHIEQWIRESGCRSSELSRLRDELEDACWLGRWKRDWVVLDLYPNVLPGIIETLIRISGEEPSMEIAETLETMVRRLSKD